MDMNTAVHYLNLQDPEMQVPGAAYIQHECYHNREAKDQVQIQHFLRCSVILCSYGAFYLVR